MYRERLLHTSVKKESAQRLKRSLLAYHDFRHACEKPETPQLNALAEWQSARLKRTHRDLYENLSYRPGLEFLLSDLYAPRDLYPRDDDIDRIFPKLVKLLPDHILDIVTNLVELNHLTQKMDRQLAQKLFIKMGLHTINEQNYIDAYPDSASREDRLHQIQLIANIGDDLEKYTRSKLLLTSLKITRKPAEVAGLSALHNFLITGFKAFNAMTEVGSLLDKIVTREKIIMENLFERKPEPFQLNR